MTGSPWCATALAPLDREDLVQLALAAAGSTVLPPGVVDDLVERSGGNPLFLQELVNGTVTGSLTDVPESIEAVVTATIDTLPARDRSLLRHAAVLGGHVPLRILAPMVDEPLDRVALALRRLSHFLVDQGDGSVRFQHILLRDVAYEGLPYRIRRKLHARAGDILEGSTEHPESMSELLSIHYDRADQPAKSWRYSRVAGERAQRNGASVEAAAFYQRALEAAPRPRRDHAGRPGRRGRTARRHVGVRGPVRTVERRLPASRGSSARVTRPGRSGCAARSGTSATTRAATTPRSAGSDAGWPSSATWTTKPPLARCERSSPSRWCRAASGWVTMPAPSRSSAGRSTTPPPAGHAARWRTRTACTTSCSWTRAATRTRRYSEQAATIYEELGDHRGLALALNEMGSTAYWLGEWDEAVRCWERAIEADRRAGALVYNAIYLNNIGEIRSDQGRFTEAEVLLREACELWTAGGWRAGTGWALSNLGRLAARDGRIDESKARLAESCSILSDIGAEALLVETQARELERCVLAGAHEEALALVDDTGTRAERLPLVSVVDLVRRLHGYTRCQAGDPEDACRLIEISVGASRERGGSYDVALGLEALARVERRLGRPDADEHDREAAEIFGQLGVVATPRVPLPGT